MQVADLLEAAHNDIGKPLQSLRVDGGMARNAWFLQCQADLLGMPVVQSPHSEAVAQSCPDRPFRSAARALRSS